MKARAVGYFVYNEKLEKVENRVLKCGNMLKNSSVKMLYRIHSLLEMHNSTVFHGKSWAWVFVLCNWKRFLSFYSFILGREIEKKILFHSLLGATLQQFERGSACASTKWFTYLLHLNIKNNLFRGRHWNTSL